MNVGMGRSKVGWRKGKTIRTSCKNDIKEEKAKTKVQPKIPDDETLDQDFTRLKLERGFKIEETQTPKMKNLVAIWYWHLGCGPNAPLLTKEEKESLRAQPSSSVKFDVNSDEDLEEFPLSDDNKME